MTRPQLLAVVASWPVEARQAFGEAFNRLAEPGLANYLDAERLAFAEVSARLERGEFTTTTSSVPAPRRPQPGSVATGQATITFGGLK